MKPTTFLLWIATGVVFAIIFISNPTVAAAQENNVKKVAITRSDPGSGKQMYKDYCAACHGISGKGDGPAAPAFKNPATDLTQLEKQNGGSYPADHVAAILTGAAVTAHGSEDMPIWGQVFRSVDALSGSNETIVKLRVHNLTNYIKTLQLKQAAGH